MMPKVFISYTHSDRDKAIQVEETLRSLGVVSIWRDEYALVAGDNFREAISNAIDHEVDVVIVILTARSAWARWVKWERERASSASAKGHHIEVIYVRMDEFDLPEEISRAVYVDFYASPELDEKAKLMRRLRASEALAKYLLRFRPWRRLGVFDVYSSYSDMDARRLTADDQPGCNMHRFLLSAKQRIVAVGYHFGNLFGPNHGIILRDWLRAPTTGPNPRIDIYVPHPDKAPLENLCYIYPYGKDIPALIRGFIEGFRSWGKTFELSETEARCVTLRLVNCCITHSLLAIDPDEPFGRMIVDIPSHPDCDYQLKVEFRFPQTPLYDRYRRTLDWLEKNKADEVTTAHC